VNIEEPFELTLYKITEIRLGQLGMPVKSTAVPEVVAWDVPNVRGCESFAGVMEPSAGVVEMALVDTVVTRPFASSVSVTAAVLVP
jgi:hypothetical protein